MLQTIRKNGIRRFASVRNPIAKVSSTDVQKIGPQNRPEIVSVQVPTMKDVFLSEGDILDDLHGPNQKTLASFLGSSALRRIAITFKKSPSAAHAEVTALSVIFCDVELSK